MLCSKGSRNRQNMAPVRGPVPGFFRRPVSVRARVIVRLLERSGRVDMSYGTRMGDAGECSGSDGLPHGCCKRTFKEGIPRGGIEISWHGPSRRERERRDAKPCYEGWAVFRQRDERPAKILRDGCNRSGTNPPTDQP